MAVVASSIVEWGVASRALPGESESGDLHLVQPLPRGVLVAVVDGLGHGAEAAAAAREAVRTLAREADPSLLPLVRRCHDVLLGTRGVVMSLAYFDGVERTMTWLGVGNVEGVLLYNDRNGRPARTALVTPGGIVGSELPRLRAGVFAVTPGDTLIFATDGVQAGFADALHLDEAPQQQADRILAAYGKGTDDALVFVARYSGGGGGAPGEPA